MYDCISSVTNRDILAITLTIHSTRTTQVLYAKCQTLLQTSRCTYQSYICSTATSTLYFREESDLIIPRVCPVLTEPPHNLPDNTATPVCFVFFIQTLCAWNISAHRVKQLNSPCVVLQSNPPTKSFLSRVDAMPLRQTLCKRHTFFFKASLQSYDITKDTATTVGRCCQSKRPQKTKGTAVFGGEDWTQCQSQQRSNNS